SPRYDPRPRTLRVDDDDFVIAIARVQDREVTAIGMDGDIDREIAEFKLCAGRPQPPLIGELDKAVAVETWEQSPRHGGCVREIGRLFARPADGREQSGCGGGQKEDGHQRSAWHRWTSRV